MRTVVFLSLFAFACSQPEHRSTKRGELDVQLNIDPDPPTTGENRLHVTLEGANGRPVDGAQLAFESSMAAMGSMPEMKGGGDVKSEGPGRYVVAYSLSMNGDWALTLGIDAPGHPHTRVRLKIAPPHKGFTLEGGGGGATPGATPAVIEVPTERQQLIGVHFATVDERPLGVSVRAAGRVEVDERKLADVTLKYEAYVEKLYVAETGKAVRQGEPLLVLYSPDLLAAQSELLSIVGAGGPAELVTAARSRLTLWDIGAAQLAALERAGKATGRVTIASPASGVVLEKGVVEGAHVVPGTMLFRIGNLGRIWVQAAIYERDAAFISLDLPAKVSIPALVGEPTDAKVTFVAPVVDAKTRTLSARLELVNAELAMKPGMFADVAIEVPLGTKLAVPDSALLLSGQHRYAFVDRGEGLLEPVEVEVGAAAGDYHEVRAGLHKGDRVATGGTFLLSSEAKLRDALPHWSKP
jgi:Cu(I)/Ag(I) efflux system membrane fusion protein